MSQTLVELVRAKHPGAYDDLDDLALDALVRSKYPGVYDDLPKPVANFRAENEPSMATKAADAVVDAGIGAAKGVGNTVFGLGKIVRDYTPVGRISDAIMPGAFDQRPAELTPTNTAQKVGMGAEQIAEFFLPTGAAGRALKAAEVGKSGLLSLAQSGDKGSAAVSAGLSAVPFGRLANRARVALTDGAEKGVAQALGGTKEWAKAESAKLAPEMLKRGVRGSREAMLERAKVEAKNVGQAIDDVIADAAARGTVVDGAVARQSIQTAKQALMVPGASGGPIPIEGAQAAVAKLDKLDEFIDQIGPAIPIEQAQRVKQAWDKIVSKAGLYGPKATSSATDNAEAWAIREAAGSFRKLLADASPDLATLNKEFAFWGGLRNVLKETQKRTQAQRGGLTDAIRGVGGAAAGAAVGGPVGAAAGQIITQNLSKLVASPWWKTSVSAPAKQRLADALASGNAEHVGNIARKILVGLPAQARVAMAQ